MDQRQPPVSWMTSLKGMAMGIAEVIPGVSGGTLALITGIYERLLNAIKAFGPRILIGWRENKLSGVWRMIDGNFLVFLLAGMALGILVGVFGVSYLLENYPPLIWAFFFGLIIASALYIGRQVQVWTVLHWALLLLGTVLAFWITIASPAQGSDSLIMVFFAGMIAISAMILPGISGSFILLLMGMYTLIIPSVKSALENQDSRSILTVLVFGVGCVIGLAAFSRLLSWTFKHYRDVTLAALTGFMLGSLNKIWPWRNVLSYRINSRGEEVPFHEASVLPGQYDGDPMLVGALLMLLIGFLSVFLIERLGGKLKTP